MGTAEISLGNNVVTVIDAEDMAVVEENGPWHLSSSGYAVHSINKREKLLLHNLLMGRKYIDHINRNKLDNRRVNLRPATHQQNQANKPGWGETSSYKGVHWKSRIGRYIAQIGHDGKKIHIGSFKTELEAARAYNKKASELFGEFAFRNEV